METVSQDRRSGRTLRVPFEALVIISGQSGNVGAYECEATDVSEQGMHLRTAYLPDLGQALTCRFETGIDEVVAEGTVVWRQEAARGGEFGVSFTRLDSRSIAALRELCGTLEPSSPSEVAAAPPPAPAKEEIPASQVAAPKSRQDRPGAVRLHLEGVSAPMSAQVRTTSDGEVLVGSHLKALKVGHAVEIEDDQKRRRNAVIDRVAVEVNPTSNVPELVVALRYSTDENGKDVAPKTKSSSERSASSSRSSSPSVSSSKSGSKNATKVSSSGPKADANDDKNDDKADASSDGKAKAAAALLIFRERASEVASKVGAQMSLAGGKARETVLDLVEKLKSKRSAASADDSEETSSPRTRGTERASGGVRVQGPGADRRGEGEEPMDEFGEGSESGEITPKKTMGPRVLALGGAAAVALLIGVVALRGRGDAGAPPGSDPAAVASVDVASAPAFPGRAAMPSPRAGGAGGDAVVANVPMFGATPLSTTEPAPMGSGNPLALANAPIPPGQPGAAPPGQGDEDEGGGAGGDEKTPGGTTFGRGNVVKPRTIRLKMDAPITEIRGAVNGTTVTLNLPGRRNIEPALPLLKRDHRIAAIKAVPGADGVEVSITFKEKVPAFLARSNKKMLEIDLGKDVKPGEEGSEVAEHTGKHGKKHGTSANKGKHDKHEKHDGKSKPHKKSKKKDKDD